MDTRTTTKRIVVHHSASPANTTRDQVDQWHRNRGFTMIGYHKLIEQNGAVKEGRPEWSVGAHAIGANGDSIGICLAGNFEEAPPTESQIVALVSTIKDIRNKYGNIPIIGHSKVDPVNHPTACPGALFPWDDLRQRLEGKVLEVKTVKEAVAVLRAQGAINSPEYWEKAAECVKYLDTLLIYFAKRLQ